MIVAELRGRLLYAAQTMRQRALDANTDEARSPYGNNRTTPVPAGEWGGLVENYLGGPIGAHCASWTPAVALAVAAWLTSMADTMDRQQVALGRDSWPDALVHADATARAYLGEPDCSPKSGVDRG